MDVRSNTGERDLEREILKYFLRHPQAADTREGVARWRLLHERVRFVVKHTSRALEWLVSEGYLLKDVRTASAPVFRINQQRRAEAERFLSDAGSSGHRARNPDQER